MDATTSGRAIAGASAPPNILYISLEDFSTLASPVFSPDNPGAGHAHRRRTPFLERLASRGLVFRHAYCQVPICNPSRTSYLTGRRPTRTHVYANEHSFPDLPTLVDLIRAADPRAHVACAGACMVKPATLAPQWYLAARLLDSGECRVFEHRTAGGKIFHLACDVDARGFTRGDLFVEQPTESGSLAAADAAAAQHLLASVHNGSSGWQRQALHATLHREPSQGRTNDQAKAAVAIRLLAHCARARALHTCSRTWHSRPHHTHTISAHVWRAAP
jgi:hypothetical protein